ncbi:ferredoxin [Streptomyces achromogenes]|uniref:ferredoxin n=1 Tax=Streptomyces achromogenes TaxID=67255 RepID=UPI0033EFEEE6
MEVSVDRALCYGSAECAHRAPDVFAFEDGYGVVRPAAVRAVGDPRIREAVLEAAEKCPSQAIALRELREPAAGPGERTGGPGERDVTRAPE